MGKTVRQVRAARQFSRQAAEYARSPAHFAAESLKVIGRLASEARYSTAVDIATGPGFTAFEIAPYADLVLATDPATGMLQQARRIASARGLSNIALAAAVAEALPLRDGGVDLVTCRTAPHHFSDVHAFLREVARVLRSGGTFIIADSSSPEDSTVENWMNDVERRRDPTHARNLRESEWRQAIADAGLILDFEATTRVYMTFSDWTARSGTPKDEVERLLADWRSAPEAAVRAFRIERTAGPVEDFNFSWPVFVCRARKIA